MTGDDSDGIGPLNFYEKRWSWVMSPQKERIMKREGKHIGVPGILRSPETDPERGRRARVD